MKIKYIIVIFLIFVTSVVVRYYPVFHKHQSYALSVDNLILARNLSLTGEYKLDDKNNIVLSSNLVKENGVTSLGGNKLTPVLYGKVFDVFGFKQGIPLWASLILYAFTEIILFLIVLRLFNFFVALLFSFIGIFSPLVIQQAIVPGGYEWAVLFLSLAIFLFLIKRKPSFLLLLASGLGFSFAALSKNSFLIIPIAFLIFEFIRSKSIKRGLVFMLPIIICWGIYLGPGIIGNKAIDNAYVSSRDTMSDKMHLFPDPYTWHFERDEYVKSAMESGAYNYDYSQFLEKYGYPVSLKNKVLMYWASIISYPKGFIAQTTFGGPIVVFLMALGSVYLYRNKKYLLGLFVLWGFLTYLFLIIAKSNHWGHFISFQFPIFLLSSLGAYWIFQFINKQEIKKHCKHLLIGGFILTLFVHLIQSSKWMLHEQYENSNMEKAMFIVDDIGKNKNYINEKEDIIAAGAYNQLPALINWYFGFNSVYFDKNTIENLLKKGELQSAFNRFGITLIAGYDKELTEKIMSSTNVKKI